MTFLQSKQLYCDLPRDDATLVQRCGADVALKIFIILATPSVIDFELVCGSFAITNMKSLSCIHVCSTHIHQHNMDVLGFSWVTVRCWFGCSRISWKCIFGTSRNRIFTIPKDAPNSDSTFFMFSKVFRYTWKPLILSSWKSNYSITYFRRHAEVRFWKK